MKKILLSLFIVLSAFVYSQPILQNPDGSIVVDGSGNIIRRNNTTRVFTFYSVQGTTITNGGVGYKIKTGGKVWIRFGGNSTTLLTANNTNQNVNSNFRTIYDTNKTHAVLIWGDLDSMTRFTLGTTNANWKVDIKQLADNFPNLHELDLSGGKVVSSSNLADFPKSLTLLSCNRLADWNNRRVWGSINDLDTNITSLSLVTTGDSIWGTTDLLSRRMTNFTIRYNTNAISAQYHINGQYKNLPPNLLTLFVWEIGGPFGGYSGTGTEWDPGVRFYGYYSELPRSITNLVLMNNFNSSRGGWTDLPPNLTNFQTHGDVRVGIVPFSSPVIVNDTTHLNLIDLPRTLLTTSIQYTDNTMAAHRKVYGNITDLPPNLTSITLQDVDTFVVGYIENLPTTLTSINFTINTNGNFGTNKITYGGGVVPAWTNTTITIRTCMTSTAVDNFLISWATTAGTGTRTVTLSKTRTSASDAAVTTLNGKGKTIVTNTTNCP